MKSYKVFFLATSGLVLLSGAAIAGKNEPADGAEFFWTDTLPEAGTSDADMTGADMSRPDPAAGAAHDAPSERAAPASAPETPVTGSPAGQNPMLETYPQDAPADQPVRPVANPLYADCFPQDGQVDTGYFRAQTAEDGRATGAQARRGAQVGDDGVLEAIQDDPCAHIYRRGGETAESAAGYTHPDDIRRVNTLEERRIPVHDVGRYEPDDARGDDWYRGDDNPYIDARKLWSMQKGRMLSEVLIAWGEEADFDVIWRSSHDYVVRADAELRGTFPEAAGEIIDSFADATPPLTGDLYPANRVLVVNTANALDRR